MIPNRRSHHNRLIGESATWFAKTSPVTSLLQRSFQNRLNNLSLAFNRESSWDYKIYWMLVLACAWCFIGHGAWGIIQKAEWLTFFRPFGIPDNLAYGIMPLIGVMDITMGIIVLFRPTRALLLWMAIWCLWTALLRPIAGLGFWEVLERGGNFGPPIAFLAWVGWGRGKNWFAGIYEKDAILTERSARRLYWVLALSIGFFLIGHGAFQALQNKEMLLLHWSAIGMPPADVDPVQFMVVIGWFEILLGLWVIFNPNSYLLVFVVLWKVFTELLYPISGQLIDTWEFIERGGDYFAPFALIFLIAWLKSNTGTEDTTVPLGRVVQNIVELSSEIPAAHMAHVAPPTASIALSQGVHETEENHCVNYRDYLAHRLLNRNGRL